MAVNLSPVGGVAAQFFTNTGAVLTGGKLYTYAAGTTTPATTFTSSNGGTAWTNPIVLDAAGRVSGSGEIWLTDGINYKFVLKDSNDVLIATYDNVSGINSNFVAFVNEQEIVTATAGQTVFNLSINYSPGTNSLSVFVDGVNQYGPGAQYAYTETDSDTVTFTSGLHVGAEVKFTTSQLQGGGAVDASQVSYIPPFTGSVATNVEVKLAQTVSVMDFGAVADGTTDCFAAFVAAVAASNDVYVPEGTYALSDMVELTAGKVVQLAAGAHIVRPSALTSNEGPLFWLKGTGAGLIGAAKMASSISTEKKCPRGVVRIGHRDMTESHDNVTYCTLANLGIYGSTNYGQTTGDPDVCVYMPNPEIGSPIKVSYFHTLRSLRVSSANIGIWLHGAANANTIDDITGQELGNATLGGAMLTVNGGSDNRISNFFFHLSPASTFIFIEDEGAFVSSMNSMTNMICEQGGNGYWLQANAGCTASSNYIQGQDNTGGGSDLSSAFLLANTVIPSNYVSTQELKAPFSRVDRSLLKDGITEPNAVTGYAILFVDTADGDLKVKFSDGVVKTIVTDV